MSLSNTQRTILEDVVCHGWFLVGVGPTTATLAWTQRHRTEPSVPVDAADVVALRGEFIRVSIETDHHAGWATAEARELFKRDLQEVGR